MKQLDKHKKLKEKTKDFRKISAYINELIAEKAKQLKVLNNNNILNERKITRS